MSSQGGGGANRQELRLFLRALAFLGPRRLRLLAACGLLLAVQAVAIALVPLLVRALIDEGIPSGELSSVVAITGGILGLYMAQVGAQIGLGWLSNVITTGVMFDIQARLFRHLHRLPFGFFTRVRVGMVLNRIINDVAGCGAMFQTLLTVAASIVAAVASIAMMSVLDWRVAAATLLAAAGIVAVAGPVGRRGKALAHQMMYAQGDLADFTEDHLDVSGNLVSRLYGSRRQVQAGFADLADTLRLLVIKRGLLHTTFEALTSSVAIALTVLAYGIGAWLAIRGDISTGTVVALATLVAQFAPPVLRLSGVTVGLRSGLASFERMFEVLDAKDPLADAADAVPLNGSAGRRIELENVSFTYDNTPLIPSMERPDAQGRTGTGHTIHEVSLVLEPGTVTALVGPTGAGKTTLGCLIARLYDPASGVVKIDGIDVRNIQAENLQRTIAIVPQETYLFHDTIEANLRFARPSATTEEIEEACRRARIHEFISSLPQGYQTVVGARGYAVSGGEKQRLAIARLLLSDPDVVILDEATAHLDTTTERRIQESLAEALKGRTCLVIAHRLATVRTADRVLVMVDGRIVEQGTHQSLLHAGGVYTSLCKTQLLT